MSIYKQFALHGQSEDFQKVLTEVDDLKAYQEGVFCWGIDPVTAILSDGIDVPVHHTYLLRR